MASVFDYSAIRERQAEISGGDPYHAADTKEWYPDGVKENKHCVTCMYPAGCPGYCRIMTDCYD